MFKKLKVSYKILFVIAAVALPLLAATLFATFKGFNKDINFAEQEKKGNVLQRPLMGLLETLPQHQWLAAAAAAGDKAAREALPEKEAQIDRYVADLEAAHAEVGAALLFTEAELTKRQRAHADAPSLKAGWQKLKQQQPALNPADSAAQHQQLVATVRTIINHAGDTSNLILDPDLDSYYLMDATLLALPQTLDRLATITTYGVDTLAKAPGTVSPSELAQFAVHAALLKESDMDRLNGSFQTALNEDANFFGVSESLQNVRAPLAAYDAAVQEFLTLLQAASANAASVTPQALLAAGQKARATTAALWKTSASELDRLLDLRAKSIRNTRNLALGGVAASLLVSLVIAGFVSRSITRPLAGLARATERVGKGDTTVRAPVYAQDEIGQLATSFNAMIETRTRIQSQIEAENKRLQTNIQDLLLVVSDASDGKLGVRARVSEGALGNVCDALNLMLENVSELIANAKNASYQVASASTEITAVAQDLERGEAQQTKEIGVTSDGVRDLNGKAQNVLLNCQAATRAAENGRKAAQEGAKAVRDVITGMDRIRENTQVNAKKIKRLGDRSLEIAGIVKVIGDISAKTDMLALNASIEAARAGEQGRGFTIVAEQVRGLADRTKTLTSQIEKLVSDIQKETGEAVAQMEAQTQEVETGARAAETAGGRLENIVTVSTESSKLVAEINTSASQQAARTQEMLQNVEAINQSVAAASLKVRETRSTSEQLLTLSSELNKRLSQFELQTVGI